MYRVIQGYIECRFFRVQGLQARMPLEISVGASLANSGFGALNPGVQDSCCEGLAGLRIICF